MERRHDYCKKTNKQRKTMQSTQTPKYQQTYHRNNSQQNPLHGPPYLVVDCHAASGILLKDFSYPIGEPFILQFGLLFTLFFLHREQRK